VANGAFSIAAIGSMMSLAGGARSDGEAREGTRMGLWGAAQAIGFALGGLFGAAASDVARWVIGNQGSAYGLVFFLEAGMFVAAAWLASKVSGTHTRVASEMPKFGPAETPNLQAAQARGPL
jgi:BCD family chlorophyll transporter-like MFS transporter